MIYEDQRLVTGRYPKDYISDSFVGEGLPGLKQSSPFINKL